MAGFTIKAFRLIRRLKWYTCICILQLHCKKQQTIVWFIFIFKLVFMFVCFFFQNMPTTTFCDRLIIGLIKGIFCLNLLSFVSTTFCFSYFHLGLVFFFLFFSVSYSKFRLFCKKKAVFEMHWFTGGFWSLT